MAWVITRRTKAGRRRFMAMYRNPQGHKRSAGTFPTHREAALAGLAAEQKVRDRRWVDPRDGRISFASYAQNVWLPQLRVEVSTKAGYHSNLNAHLVPAFGRLPINGVTPEDVQRWVDEAADKLSAVSIVKYHAVLSLVFAHAVAKRLRETNPCHDTVLPPVPTRNSRAQLRRVLTPREFDLFLGGFGERHATLVLTDIETGLRWGELIALRPCDLDVDRRLLVVRRVIVEVSRAHSPTGERFLIKEYPKDREPRAVRISVTLVRRLREHIEQYRIGGEELMFTFARRPGQPMSRHTFRKRHRLPAAQKAGLDFTPTMQDLRHAHASWLVAGQCDLHTVKERLGHGSLATTEGYLHSLPDAQDRAVAVFEAVRDGGRHARPRHHRRSRRVELAARPGRPHAAAVARRAAHRAVRRR